MHSGPVCMNSLTSQQTVQHLPSLPWPRESLPVWPASSASLAASFPGPSGMTKGFGGVNWKAEETDGRVIYAIYSGLRG